MRECDQSENYQPLLEYLNTQYDDDVERMVNETTVRWAHAHRDQYFKLAPRLSSARLKGLSDLVERLQRERDEIRERVNANK
jgi:sulfur transfer protein SufE